MDWYADGLQDTPWQERRRRYSAGQVKEDQRIVYSCPGGPEYAGGQLCREGDEGGVGFHV